jgi:hypothetical protein
LQGSRLGQALEERTKIYRVPLFTKKASILCTF